MITTPDATTLLGLRTKRLDAYSYKLSEGNQYGLDFVMADEPEVDEGEMSFWLPYADGNRRDGVGDLLEIEGIDFSRHQKNPISLFDHGKQVQLPIGAVRDPKTGEYTGEVDLGARTARDKVFVYQGKGMKGVDRGREYDHALFCNQVFDLWAKRFLNGGSIGYQVMSARHIPADYERGTPKGLHLIRVKKLESSVVVLPANADTARKMLDMPRVCGKSLSPYLVKSLEPYASPRKATMLVHAKGLHQELQKVVDECASLEKEDTKGGIAVWVSPDEDEVVIDVMDWGDSKLGDRIGKVAKSVVGEDKVHFQNEGARPEGWTRVEATKKPKSESKSLPGDLRQKYKKFWQANKRAERRRSTTRFGVVCKHQGKTAKFELDAGNSDEAWALARHLSSKRAGMPGASVSSVRMIVDTKSLPRETKAMPTMPPPRRPMPSPGQTGGGPGMPPPPGGGAAAGMGTAPPPPGPGAPPPGAPPVEPEMPMGDATPPVDPGMGDPNMDPAMGGGSLEKHGAQMLRRFHDDHVVLMQDYDEMMALLEDDEVRAHFMNHLGAVEQALTETERLWAQKYGNHGYPPLQGMAMPVDPMQTDPMQPPVDPTMDQEMPAEDGDPDGVEGDMDTMQDEGVEADSDPEDLPPAEEAVEGMDKGPEEAQESVESDDDGDTDDDGVPDEDEFQGKSLTGLAGVRAKYKRTSVPGRKAVKGRGKCKCGQKPCKCGTKAVAGKKGQKAMPEDVGGDVGGLAEHEMAAVGSAGGFLKELSEPDSLFDDEHRFMSFHYHKTLDGIAQLEQAHEDLEKTPPGDDVPPAEFEPGAGAKAVTPVRPVQPVSGRNTNVCQPGQTSEETGCTPAGKVKSFEEWQDEFPESWTPRKHCGAASRLFKELSTERAFGDPHRGKCAYMAKRLDSLMPKQEEKDHLPEDMEEEGAGGPTGEPGEMGEKWLVAEELDRQRRELKEMADELRAITVTW